MRWTDYDSGTCSIARSLAVLGDRWTLLLMRDLTNGVHRFEELRDHVGVSRDVLSKRLAALVAAGVVERRAYRDGGARSRAAYHLTEAGLELQPVLVALMAWGDRHLSESAGPPAVLEHVGCGGAVTTELSCDEGHRPARNEVRLRPTAAARLRPGRP